MKPNPPLSRGKYLTIYSGLCAVQWGAILISIIYGLYYKGNDYTALWSSIWVQLVVVQSLATLEIFHAALGLVKAGVVPTFCQVSSRLVVLYGYLLTCKESRYQYAMVLCVGSWCLAEIPRYIYYCYSQINPERIPNTLVWLRYSLFFVLYPSGILGELLTIYNSIGCIKESTVHVGPITTSAYTLTVLLVLLYIPFAPYLYYHMVKARRRTFKKKWGHEKRKVK